MGKWHGRACSIRSSEQDLIKQQRQICLIMFNSWPRCAKVKKSLGSCPHHEQAAEESKAASCFLCRSPVWHRSEGVSAMIGSGDRKTDSLLFSTSLPWQSVLSNQPAYPRRGEKTANTGATIRFTYRFKLVWKRVAHIEALENTYLPTMRCTVKCEENEFCPQVAALFFWKQIAQSRSVAETIFRLSFTQSRLSHFFSLSFHFLYFSCFSPWKNDQVETPVVSAQ